MSREFSIRNKYAFSLPHNTKIFNDKWLNKFRGVATENCSKSIYIAVFMYERFTLYILVRASRKRIPKCVEKPLKFYLSCILFYIQMVVQLNREILSFPNEMREKRNLKGIIFW